MTQLSERIHRVLNGGEQNRDFNRWQQGVELTQGYRGALAVSLDIPTDPNVVWGVDLAGIYDGVPDYAKLKARGCRFVIIKAADGTLRARLFDENVKAARDAGIEVVGGYCWLYKTSRISASAQAAAWWNIVKDYGLDLVVVDYEWTSWNGQPDNPTHSDLDAVTAAFERLAGFPMWVYSAPGYLAQYPITLGNRPLWIANYNVAQPNTTLPWKIWQCSETWPGSELGFTESNAEDGDIYNGTDGQFKANFGLTEPEAYIVERSLSDYEICFTPQSTLALSLMSAVEQANQYGWEAAMNGGPGFDYTDASHAMPRDAGYEKVNGIPYARRLIENGNVNSNLDAAYKAPWSILAFRDTRVALIVTRGLEGSSGMTQAGAAEWCKAQGYEQAYLMDSGRSSQICENGVMTYWPYAPDEKVPQHIGLKRKGANVATLKGVCKYGMVANIKDKSTGLLKHTMIAGEYVYGVDSLAHTDIIDFDHYYTAQGVKMPLGVLCKVSKTSLTVTNEAEPGIEPPPPPEPTVTKTHTIDVYSDGSVRVDGNLI